MEAIAEESIALSPDETRMKPMLLDIATFHEGKAKLITDGATADDLEKKQIIELLSAAVSYYALIKDSIGLMV